MSALDDQINKLVSEERYEEAQALRDLHRPSRSIWEALTRWVDAKRIKRYTAHAHAWKVSQRVYLDRWASGTYYPAGCLGGYTHIRITYRCECGEERTELHKQ